MTRFVKLTGTDGEPVWVLPAWINTVGRYKDHTLVNGCAVRETPEQILALLDAPGTAEVTEAAVEAACAAEIRLRAGPAAYTDRMAAAIEAADRARGLRP